MNWVIRNSSQIRYQTDLQAITAPFRGELTQFKWWISDLEYRSDPDSDLPVDLESEFFLLSGEDFARLAGADVQIIWGSIIAIPEFDTTQIDATQIPFVDGNAAVWEENNFQFPNAEIEIACFDSGYTIVKFKSEARSQKFHAAFPEAIRLSDFVRKYF